MLKFHKKHISSLIFSACFSAGGTAAFADSNFFDKDRGGSVFVMTNAPEENEILVYSRNRSGELKQVRGLTVATGGEGAGDNAPVDPLGSQNSLVFDDESNSLIAVNAGDNSVSVLQVGKLGLRLSLSDNVSSGGLLPVSVAVDEDMVYVLNVGGEGALTTFSLDDGKLVQQSSVSLGMNNSTSVPFNNVFTPGQVGIDALSQHAFIVNANGQELLTIDLDAEGLPTGEFTSTPTPGVVPFAFDTTRFGTTVVAEAGSGAVSSFAATNSDNSLSLLSTLVSTEQAAACWIVIHDNGFAYVSNTASDSISSFTVDRLGEVTSLESIAATTEAAPTDMTFAADQQFLYTLDAAAGVISAFSVNQETGALTLVEREASLPAAQGIQGIASFDR